MGICVSRQNELNILLNGLSDVLPPLTADKPAIVAVLQVFQIYFNTKVQNNSSPQDFTFYFLIISWSFLRKRIRIGKSPLKKAWTITTSACGRRSFFPGIQSTNQSSSRGRIDLANGGTAPHHPSWWHQSRKPNHAASGCSWTSTYHGAGGGRIQGTGSFLASTLSILRVLKVPRNVVHRNRLRWSLIRSRMSPG